MSPALLQDSQPMSTPSLDALWLNLSPRLKRFNLRLLQQLQTHPSVATSLIGCWDYHQTLDEPCCFEAALTLLHEAIRSGDRPLHLLGHGSSAGLALRYAQRYPQWVRSLTLLSVGSEPTQSWHDHYYALRQLLPCSRSMILAQMVRSLFGQQGPSLTKTFIKILATDLDSALAPHSLAHYTHFEVEHVEPPILVAIGAQDTLLAPINAPSLSWLKPSDRLYHCPEGRHFFHYDYPCRMAQVISDFWVALESPASLVAA
ncbi:MAG: alpha/beta hydrolase [Cyanobacteria bacterium P01_G01_bin.54]